jgi:hypothetical protein
VFLRIISYRSGITPTFASCHRCALDVVGASARRNSVNAVALVGTQLIAHVTTHAERHNLAPIGNIQPDISETQLQAREVTPASWAATKRDLTWTTTTQLTSYLQLLSVVGVSNAIDKMKIDAIAA